MAGAKTRFGYLGSGGADEPPHGGDVGPARTVIGHDIHLPPLPSGFPPSPTPVPPRPSPRVPMAMAPFVRAPIPTPMTEAVTEAIPERRSGRPQPSRLARFLGRWTTGGHFRASNPLGASDMTDEDLRLPRDTAARNALLVLAIAALTFLITFAIMRWREPQRAAPAAQPPAVPTRLAAPPLTPTVEAPPPSAVVPTAIPAPGVAATPAAKVLPAPQPPAMPRATIRPQRAGQATRATSQPPAHLKDELLPLTPQM